MTELTKKVSRRVTIFTDNRITARDRDKITVTLHPDGTIGFRAHKCRREYRLPLSTAFRMAVQAQKIEEWKEKDKQARLFGKRRPKKFKRSSLLFK